MVSTASPSAALSAFAGRRVFVTGHTGFKGAWLALLLARLDARVSGYALAPNTTPSLFDAARVAPALAQHTVGDVRDAAALTRALHAAKPEIVLHLAAQPLVRASYRDPAETWSTNVMGTVNLLDAVRTCPSVRAVIVVTTDKCYDNKEWLWGYRETDPLGGHDPYSASKAGTELVAASYRKSFLAERGVLLATARAGNVIGGGDWAEDRLIPDIVRAIVAGKRVSIRSPQAVRPWQHVLEALRGYLLIAERLAMGDAAAAAAWNFGPSADDTQSVGWIVDRMIASWGAGDFELEKGSQPHEANLLMLDCSKARSALGWRPALNLTMALERVVSWHRAVQDGADARAVTRAQLNEYRALTNRALALETL